MYCVCNHEMTKHEYKNKWVCHRCGRSKPIVIQLTNREKMIELLEENDAEGLLDWLQEEFKDGVPNADYFEWWLDRYDD